MRGASSILGPCIQARSGVHESMTQCILCPSGLISIMPAPDPILLEALSIYRVHYSASLSIDTEFSHCLTPIACTASPLLVVPVTSAVLEQVNSTMKLARAYPFIIVQG